MDYGRIASDGHPARGIFKRGMAVANRFNQKGILKGYLSYAPAGLDLLTNIAINIFIILGKQSQLFLPVF
ncbi:hypothetical protein GCM10027566_28770 [Arachidicoccus ginsenosidivorans]